MATDIVTALTTAVSTLVADFGDILVVVIPATFGIAVGLLLYRRARGLIK